MLVTSLARENKKECILIKIKYCEGIYVLTTYVITTFFLLTIKLFKSFLNKIIVYLSFIIFLPDAHV